MAEDNTTDKDRRLSIVLTNTERANGDNKNVRFYDDGQDDIIAETKITLGNHAASKTKNSVNMFALSNGDSVNEISIRGSDGNTTAPIDSSKTSLHGAESTFFSSLDSQDAVDRFNQNSQTGLFIVDSETKLEVLKGKQLNTGKVTFQDLINNVNTQAEAGKGNKVSEIISKRMVESSRFSVDNQYIRQDVNPTENNSGTNGFVIQSQLGNHSANPENNQHLVTIDQLKNLGVQVLLKASGEYYVPKDEGDPKQSFGAFAATLAPGKARLGQRVNYGDFRPNNIMASVNENYPVKAAQDLSDNGNDKKSFGNPNNPLVPFDGFSDASSLVASQAMMRVIQGMTLALANSLDTYKKTSRSISSFGDITNNNNSVYESHKANLGIYSNGSRLPKSTDQGSTILSGLLDTGVSTDNFFGLVSTKNDYSSAVREGLKLFFNAQSNGNITYSSPGFGNTIFRTIIRDTTDIVYSIPFSGKLRDQKGTLEVGSNKTQDTGNFTNTIENTVKLITNLKNNRLFRFMNIMALLGDAALNQEQIYTYLDESTSKYLKDDLGNQQVDVVPSNIKMEVLQKKSRLSNKVNKGSGGVSWASNTVTSMYLLPDSIKIGANQYFNDSKRLLEMNKGNYFKSPSGGVTNRLSKEDVEQIEGQLNTYYMPFYFHDLRTNEIIAFHAFLSSLSDGFNTDLEETTSYGRVGRSYKWKNTTRDLSLEFIAVATNPQDFDEMWYKINKLTTLTMPQYSEGRRMEYSEDGNTENKQNFIQPFSQIPTNSPLIRMRLGDLFTNNYSDFDMARVFGLGTNLYQGNPSATESFSALATNTDNVLNSVQRLYANLNTKNYSALANTSFITMHEFAVSKKIQRRGLQETFVYKALNTPQNVTNENEYQVIPVGTSIQIISDASNETKIFDCIKATVDGVEVFIELNGMAASLLKPDTNSINLGASDSAVITPTADSSVQTFVQTFLNPANNSVLKAFESTAGEGMAGFIKNIKFNMDTGDLWSTDATDNRRAPMMVRISIDFAPIFDVNPGLDSQGFMIGAPYNVGSIMRKLKEKRQQFPANQSTTGQ